MKYKLIIYVFLVFLTFNLVSAGWWNATEIRFCYDYEDNLDDYYNQYDGVGQGNPTYEAGGVSGKRINLDGSGDRIRNAITSYLNSSSNFTFCTWSLTDACDGNNQVLFGYYDGDNRVSATCLASSTVRLHAGKYSEDLLSVDSGAGFIPEGEGHLYCYRYKQTGAGSGNVSFSRDNNTFISVAGSVSDFVSSENFTIGDRDTDGMEWDGKLDTSFLIMRYINQTELDLLYNSGNYRSCSEIYNLTGSISGGIGFSPDVVLNVPANNTHNNQPLFINFTYSDPDGDSGNCTVYINNSDEKKTFVSITNNTWRNYTSNMSVDGNYYFYVNCTDNNSNDVRSGNYYFTYDTISPQITWINPTNNDTLLSLSNNTFNIIINFSDTNLYKTLINITNSFGVSKWYDYTENISGVNDFHNHTINISSWGIGKYTIRAEAVDDHTFGPLRGLSYSFSEGKLTLSKGGWEKDILVGYYLNGDYSLLSSQQIRNYDVSFSAGIVNNEIKFNLSFTRPVVDVKFGFAIPKRGLVIRNKSKGHFVWKDWYIDFSDMLSDGFLIKFLETKDYYVIYTSTEYCGSAVGETCVFDPLIGGLNNISSERYFVIDTPAVVNFVNITPSTAYYYDDLTCKFSAYHSLNDINISAYWLVNNSVVWGVNLTNASDNVTYNITLNSSLVEPNSNIYCYVNVTDGYVLQSNYSNITVGDLPPNITSWYPQNLSFNISEGVNQSFNVTVFDDAGVVWYKWLLDGIVKVFTQVWDWITGYESSGVHNVTVVVNDTSNQTDMKTWSVTVSNVNIAPVVNALSSSETVVYQNYPNVTIYCNTTDEDTAVENLTVHIQFRDSDDLLWRDTSESYSGGLWFSTFDPDNVDLGLVDIRCKANDGDLDSDWYTLNNHIIVYEAQYPPTTPTELMPTGGEFDYSIIVTCSGATDNNTAQKIYYLIEYSVEGGSWSLLSNNTAGIGFFDMAEHMEYNETADFRCMAVDSEGWNSSWYNPSGDISRNRTIDLFLFEPSYNSYYVAYTPKQLGVHGSVRGLSNISIISTFMDCNGDGIWDYFVDNTSGWDVNGSVQEFDEYYWCMFKPGVIYIEIGMTLAKQSDMDWPGSLGVCSNSISDECRLVRQYPVWVRY